jgi:hypothetical protein
MIYDFAFVSEFNILVGSDICWFSCLPTASTPPSKHPLLTYMAALAAALYEHTGDLKAANTTHDVRFSDMAIILNPQERVIDAVAKGVARFFDAPDPFSRGRVRQFTVCVGSIRVAGATHLVDYPSEDAVAFVAPTKLAQLSDVILGCFERRDRGLQLHPEFARALASADTELGAQSCQPAPSPPRRAFASCALSLRSEDDTARAAEELTTLKMQRQRGEALPWLLRHDTTGKHDAYIATIAQVFALWYGTPQTTSAFQNFCDGWAVALWASFPARRCAGIQHAPEFEMPDLPVTESHTLTVVVVPLTPNVACATNPRHAEPRYTIDARFTATPLWPALATVDGEVQRGSRRRYVAPTSKAMIIH